MEDVQREVKPNAKNWKIFMLSGILRKSFTITQNSQFVTSDNSLKFSSFSNCI